MQDSNQNHSLAGKTEEAGSACQFLQKTAQLLRRKSRQTGFANEHVEKPSKFQIKDFKILLIDVLFYHYEIVTKIIKRKAVKGSINPHGSFETVKKMKN